MNRRQELLMVPVSMHLQRWHQHLDLCQGVFTTSMYVDFAESMNFHHPLCLLLPLALLCSHTILPHRGRQGWEPIYSTSLAPVLQNTVTTLYFLWSLPASLTKTRSPTPQACWASLTFHAHTFFSLAEIQCIGLPGHLQMLLYLQW